MITPEYVVTMARYNTWQNTSLYQAANDLTDAQRREDRGAFFKSIHGTFCHILWGDQAWMSRFSDTPEPPGSNAESAGMVADWDALRAVRSHFDAVISDWAGTVTQEQLSHDLSWHSGVLGREVTAPLTLLVAHFFNHQTHHRGQIHAMLTAAGATPDDTDLMVLQFRK